MCVSRCSIAIDYCYLDGSWKTKAEPILAAWGITTDGAAVFHGLSPGTSESTDAWRDFVADLKERGLAEPLLVISGGGKGLFAAIEAEFNKSLVSRR